LLGVTIWSIRIVNQDVDQVPGCYESREALLIATLHYVINVLSRAGLGRVSVVSDGFRVSLLEGGVCCQSSVPVVADRQLLIQS
jgi:hypothetical protein